MSTVTTDHVTANTDAEEAGYYLAKYWADAELEVASLDERARRFPNPPTILDAYDDADIGEWWTELPAFDSYPPPPDPLLTRDDGHSMIPATGYVEIIGAWGTGKSWLAMRAAAEALRSGRRVAYISHEGAMRDFHERMRLLGCTDDVLRDIDRFRLVRGVEQADNLVLAGYHEEPWLHDAVVVIDTVSRSGGTSNDADAMEQWLSGHVIQFVNRGCLVLAVDHVQKHIADDIVATSSRGSGAKSSNADLTLHIVGYRKRSGRMIPTCWDRTKAGYFDVFVAKPHRAGHISADGEHGAICRVVGDYDLALGRAFRMHLSAPSSDDDETPVDHAPAVLDILEATDGLAYGALRTALQSRGIGKNKAEQAIADAITRKWVYTDRKGSATIHKMTFEGMAESDKGRNTS